MDAVNLLNIENEKILNGLNSWSEFTMDKLDALEQQIDAALALQSGTDSPKAEFKKWRKNVCAKI